MQSKRRLLNFVQFWVNAPVDVVQFLTLRSSTGRLSTYINWNVGEIIIWLKVFRGLQILYVLCFIPVLSSFYNVT